MQLPTQNNVAVLQDSGRRYIYENKKLRSEVKKAPREIQIAGVDSKLCDDDGNNIIDRVTGGNIHFK